MNNNTTRRTHKWLNELFLINSNLKMGEGRFRELNLVTSLPTSRGYSISSHEEVAFKTIKLLDELDQSLKPPLKKEKLVKNLVHLYLGLNMIMPFAYGNKKTTKRFIKRLCHEFGKGLDNINFLDEYGLTGVYSKDLEQLTPFFASNLFSLLRP